jgi:hypothetical protein
MNELNKIHLNKNENKYIGSKIWFNNWSKLKQRNSIGARGDRRAAQKSTMIDSNKYLDSSSKSFENKSIKI